MTGENIKSVWFIAAIAGVLVVIAVAAYVINFFDNPFSSNPTDWAQFGGYIGGTLGPPLAFLGLLGLLLTIRIQFSTLKHSETAFRQQQDYIVRKEKKEEWLAIIRDLEEQIRRYLALPIIKNGARVAELSNLINEVHDRMHRAGRLNDKVFADQILGELADGINTNALNGLSALLASLASCLLRYRALLVEEDKDEIVAHYISSYIHWFHRLRWIGVMSEADGALLDKLMFAAAYESQEVS